MRIRSSDERRAALIGKAGPAELADLVGPLSRPHAREGPLDVWPLREWPPRAQSSALTAFRRIEILTFAQVVGRAGFEPATDGL